MDYKKILLPLVLLVLLTVAVSAVSAADNSTVSLSDNSNSANSVLQVNATTTTHNISAGSDTDTIQGVINNATAGDTVYFQAGTYKDINGVNITKQLNIVGAGENQTNIYGSGDGKSNVIFNVVADNLTSPDGTTITGISFFMQQNNAFSKCLFDYL